MQTSEFYYDLPGHLIAQYPLKERSSSRLLHLTRAASQDKTNKINHQLFSDLPQLLNPGDLLIFNDTRVIPARMYGKKATGGKVEILVERLLNPNQCLAHLRASKTPKPGSTIIIQGHEQRCELKVESRLDDLFTLSTPYSKTIPELLEQAGHIPLPPYITRQDETIDIERYQTVYSKQRGAVAAPTAGLHFDQSILSQLANRGVNTCYVTLHVGAGTFQPVRTANIEEHTMHSEYIEVPQGTVDLCEKTRQQGGRLIAVGTTSVRALETASRNGQLTTYSGDTDIFIYPGYQFKSVDALITNFHLPESTLLMLVSAFADKASIMAAYHEAIKQEYRFFSYGDAMLID